MTHKHPHGKHETTLVIGQYGGFQIDVGISELIVYIWMRNVRTYQSCEGSADEDAYLIIDKNGLEAIKDLLPKDIHVEEGSGGYDLKDYHPRPPAQENLIYISWKK